MLNSARAPPGKGSLNSATQTQDPAAAGTTPAVETVRFGYAGRDYEIDLSEDHAAELDELLAPYVEHARRVNGAKPSRGRRSAGQRRCPTELHAIRQWAREQGLQVSDRGRIAADIVAKYDAAH